MTIEELAQRVKALESDVLSMKQARSSQSASATSWIDLIAGTMKDDPGFEEMLRLGKEWRETQREDYDNKPLEAGAA